MPLPVAELAKRSGDAANGEKVFGTVCAICHQVNGVGTKLGPALNGLAVAREVFAERDADVAAARAYWLGQPLD